MPYLTIGALEQMMGALAITQLSLHSFFDSSGSALSELVGGGYARQPVTFSTSNGLLVSDIPPLATYVAQFSVPASTISYIGLWDASNVFLGMVPISATNAFPFTLGGDLTTLTYSNSSVLNQFNQVAIWNSSASTPIVAEGSIAYVVNATATTAQLSATFLGIPLTFGNTGGGFLQVVSPTTFASPGTFGVSFITISPFVVS